MTKMSPGVPPLFPTIRSLSAAALAVLFVGCSSSSPANPGRDAGGDGGSDASVTPACPGEDDLISDFTTDNGVKPIDGRQGGWYTYADVSGFGTIMPREGMGVVPDTTQGNPVCSKEGSLHVSASGFTDWGAAMGTDFKAKTANDGGMVAKGTYDASKYRGISFWAKSANMPIKFVMVKFLDPYTERESILSAAERCDYKANMPTINCSPYIVKFGYGYRAEDMIDVDFPKYADYKIDTTWKRFEVLFADAKQDRFNPGKQSPGNKLDTSQLIGMAIQINTDHATTPPTANDFEIWVDDVAFIK